VSKPDRKNADRNDGVPRTLTTIPLTDPHALSVEPSIGELVKDATAQMSTLVRAEVELARSEITRDVKKGLTGSVFFISALVVLFYSTFFFFLLPGRAARYLALALGGLPDRVRDHGGGNRGAGFVRLSEGPAHPRTAADHRIGQGDADGFHVGS